MENNKNKMKGERNRKNICNANVSSKRFRQLKTIISTMASVNMPWMYKKKIK